MESSTLKKRVRRLCSLINERGIDGVVIVPGPNMYYLTGVRSLLLERPFMLFVSKESDLYLLAPKLESGPYRKLDEIKIYEWTDQEGPKNALQSIIKDVGRGKWALDGRTPFNYAYMLLKDLELEDGQNLLLDLRSVKDDEERRLMKKSSEILSAAFRKLPELVKKGMSEKELARELSNLIYSLGAEHVEDVLVQAGKNASNPHWLPSDKKLSEGELIVVDISSTYMGYYSDITRTVSVGSCNEYEKYYNEVLEAKEQAAGNASKGKKAEDVDNIARGWLEKAGLSKYFIHRTGHGLGLEVHEKPYLVKGNKEELSDWMYFTVEPGVYVPGKFGIRIEDNYYIKGSAFDITEVPEEFGWWK